ncbi:MAG: hypothetical protein JNN07_00510 [Verrucomicrobiales bacterium]|nr:hypothetical protein [Verrucomicrobiales bacterium]
MKTPSAPLGNARTAMYRARFSALIPCPFPMLICALSFGVTLLTGMVYAATLPDTSLETMVKAIEQGGWVRIAHDHRYILTNSLTITRDTIVDARGYDVTFDGQDATRLIEIRPGATLYVYHLTLTRGRHVGAPGPKGGRGGDGMGGAILNDHGTLNAFDCRLIGNHVQGGDGDLVVSVPSEPSFPVPEGIPGGGAYGGAVFSQGGALHFQKCEFTSNLASGGNASDVHASFYLEAKGGSARGGGLYSIDGSVLLQNCQFHENRTLAGRGTSWPGFGFPEIGPSGESEGAGYFHASGEGVIEDCAFARNHALGGEPSRGGAVCLQAESLRIAGGTFIDNRAEGAPSRTKYGVGFSGYGGAIFSLGLLDMQDSRLYGNRALSHGKDAFGGAIYSAGSANLNRALFVTNLCGTFKSGYVPPESQLTYGQVFGGAICNTNALILLNSTFIGNAARVRADLADGAGGFVVNGGTNAYGGALFNQGSCQATNNTFTANAAIAGPIHDGDGFGGAVCSLSGQFILSHATVANNVAEGGGTNLNSSTSVGEGLGGGLFSALRSITLVNTLLAHNLPGSNGVGNVIDAGGNLSSDLSFRFASGLNEVDPRFGPLALYGGTLPVLPLLPGSPAIDAGNSAGCASTDQRGVSRPAGSGCDIGAFESHGELAIESLVQEWADDSHLRLIYAGANGSTRVLQSSFDLELWSPVGTEYSLGEKGWFEAVMPVNFQAPLRAFRVVAP